LTSKAWLIVAIVLVVVGVVVGGVYAGLIASALGGAAVTRARREEREQIKEQETIEAKKQKRIEQINRDLKMEARVMQHRTTAELKAQILDDSDEILGGGRR
jgi:uncharacterized protein HemX